MATHKELIETFKTFTGVNDDDAKRYLETTDWDHEQAVMLYYSTMQDGGIGSSDVPQPRIDHKVQEFATKHNVDIKTAEAMLNAQGFQEEEEVRAPMTFESARLFDPDIGDVFARNDLVASRNLELEGRQQEAKRRAALIDADGTQHADILEEQQMFEPPRALLFHGNFEDARNFGKEKGKWVLVNIQDNREFFSHVLNRDLWAADMIIEIVSSNFVFFQRERQDDDSQRYITLYKITKFPHVAIVNPRTGEMLLDVDFKFKGKNVDPNDIQMRFFEKISNFLEVNPMVSSAHVPPSLIHGSQARMTPPMPPAVSSSSSRSPAATPQSPAATPSSPAAAPSSPAAQPSAPLPIYPALADEPAKGDPNAGPIRIRLMDGKTASRSFSKDHQVGQLFAFVQSSVPEAQSRAFDITQTNPKMSLQDKMTDTIGDLGLIRSTLTSTWL